MDDDDVLQSSGVRMGGGSGGWGLGTEVPVASRDKPEVEGFWLINA